jgi:hypothetical protein
VQADRRAMLEGEVRRYVHEHGVPGFCTAAALLSGEVTLDAATDALCRMDVKAVNPAHEPHGHVIVRVWHGCLAVVR